MATNLTGYRVFIASPGGLDSERLAFRKTLLEFNEDDGHDRGLAFLPVGWETTLAGIGRPQELINREVREADYCVLILWDRWGTPSSNSPGGYSSGTEEEYEIARQCLAAPELPMRDIVVLFKGVDERQLSDPGDQLRKVLDFRNRLDVEKSLLFSTFDVEGDLRRILNRHLLRWARDGDQPVTVSRLGPETKAREDVGIAVGVGPDISSTDNLAKIAQILAGSETSAATETAFARVLAATDDPSVLTQYIAYLRRSGRLSHADHMSRRLLDVGDRRGNPQIMIEARTSLGISARMQGRLRESQDQFERAIQIARDADHAASLAFCLGNLGQTLRRAGKRRAAVKALNEALTLTGPLSMRRAHSLNTLALIQEDLGKYEYALSLHREALAIFEARSRPSGVATTQAQLGHVFEETGKLSEADKCYHSALQASQSIEDARGQSVALVGLGRTALARGDSDEARRLGDASFRMSEQIGDEGVASALLLLGSISLVDGDVDAADQSLGEALALFKNTNNSLGQVWCLIRLAQARACREDRAVALRYVSSAETLLQQMSSVALRREVDAVKQSLASH